MRIVILLFGLFAAGFASVVMLYGVGFIGNFIVPKTIDSGAVASSTAALLVNSALFLLFGLQHSIMARQRFKSCWVTVVPKAVERSIYVLSSGLVLALLFWQWRPIPEILWRVEEAPGRPFLIGVYFLGWGIVLFSALLIDPFELFGLRQAWCHFRGSEFVPPVFTARSLYRWVRHPLMLGLTIAVWAAPTMTVGHCLFAAAATVYIFIGVALEERELVQLYGESYRQYQASTPMLLPMLRKTSRRQPKA